MDCKTALRLINLLMDDELPEDRVLELNKHIVLCPECANELEDLRRTYDALDGWQSSQPNFTLGDVKARAAMHRTWWQQLASAIQPPQCLRWSTALGIAFCVFIGVASGISLDGVRQSTDRTAAVDALTVGFNDPISDALPWLVHTTSNSRSTNNLQEDSL